MAPKKRGRKSPEPSYVEAEEPRADPEHFDNFSDLRLKEDHAARPLWICPDLSIFLEARARARARLLELRRARHGGDPPPARRPSRRCTRKPTTSSSRSRSRSRGPRWSTSTSSRSTRCTRPSPCRSTPRRAQPPHSTLRALRHIPSLTHTHAARLEQNIIKVLDRLSKCELPAEVVQFVRDSTQNFGKAKLVLKHNRHYIEAADAEVLRKLLKNKTVAAARIADDARAGDAAAASSDADGFQVNDALVEMDANLEYRLLADEVRAWRARGTRSRRGTARSAGRARARAVWRLRRSIATAAIRTTRTTRRITTTAPRSRGSSARRTRARARRAARRARWRRARSRRRSRRSRSASLRRGGAALAPARFGPSLSLLTRALARTHTPVARARRTKSRR